MGYIRPPSMAQGEMLTAQQWNQYIVNNMAEGIPGKFAAKGDLLMGGGADLSTRLASPQDYYHNGKGLRITNGVPAWDIADVAVVSRTTLYELQAQEDFAPILFNNIHLQSDNFITMSSNDVRFTVLRTGHYISSFYVSLLTGVGSGAPAGAIYRIYCGVFNSAGTLLARYLLAEYVEKVAHGAHYTQALRGHVAFALTAGWRLQLQITNNHQLRIQNGYWSTRRVK